MRTENHNYEDRGERIISLMDLHHRINLDSMNDIYPSNVIYQIKQMVTNGINTPDSRGQTALLWAVHFRRVKIISALIDKGADMNARDNTSKTVLMHAARLGSLESVQTLLEKGADVNSTDENGYSALMHAINGMDAIAGNWIDIVGILIDKGADVNVKDSDGKTPLTWAAKSWRMNQEEIKQKEADEWQQKYANCARLLIDNGADVTAAVLQTAINSGNKEIENMVRPIFDAAAEKSFLDFLDSRPAMVPLAGATVQ